MITQSASRIVDTGIRRNRILEEEKDVYLYGYTILIETLICMICSLAIGIVFVKIIELLLFLGSFILLRTFGGGYHANTAKNCITLSALMIAVFCITIRSRIFIDQSFGLILIVGISTIIVFLLRSKITVKEEVVEKRRTSVTRMLYLLFLLMTCILHYYKLNDYAVCISLSQLVWLTSLVVSLAKTDYS